VIRAGLIAALGLVAGAGLAAHGEASMTPSDRPAGQTAAAPTLLRAATDRIRYEAGNPGFRGRTAVELRGDGSVEVSFQREAEIDTYRLQLPPADFEALRQQLGAADPKGLRASRDTAAPDEDQVQIVVADSSGRTEVEAWYGEQWTNPKLQALIALFSALADRASGGKIPV
jgi:hypothetical protein